MPSSSSVGDRPYVGPANPLAPRKVARVGRGLVEQVYEDGTLLQVSAPIGGDVIQGLPAGGVYSGVFEEGGEVFINIWYPNMLSVN